MSPELEALPSRHDRVWLRPGWPAHAVAPLPPDTADALAEWFARGRPAVASRRGPGIGDSVALGVTLPADRGRTRIGLAVGRGAVAQVARPLPLAEAIPSAPVAWRAPLARLDEAAAAAGVSLAVYGSLSWQHQTGERYLRPTSDVDLVARPRSRAQLVRILGLLADREGGPGPRLDGEIVFGRDRAVAWREMASGRPRVLVKSDDGVGLEEVAAVVALLPEEED